MTMSSDFINAKERTWQAIRNHFKCTAALRDEKQTRCLVLYSLPIW